MKHVLVVVALFACGVGASPTDARDASDVPECPTTGLLLGRVPVFPRVDVRVSSATTRGSMDTSKFVGSSSASFEIVRAFYTACLASAPEIDGDRAYFARPYEGSWIPGKGPAVIDVPEEMCDRVELSRDGERSRLEIVVVFPYGRGGDPPRLRGSTTEAGLPADDASPE